ncbi:hypothetical protein ABFS83_14G004100 [Erythranthe nasuta]
MDPHSNIKLLFVSLFILVSIDAARSRNLIGVDPNLKKICEYTDHPALCFSTVTPLLKGGKANANTVLEVAVKAGETLAKSAYAVVKSLAAKPGTPPDVFSTLKDCKDGYETVVDNYEETLGSFSVHDLGTVRAKLSGILTWIGDCEDEFHDMGAISPLTGYAQMLTNMTSNCLAISELLL